MSSTDMDPRVTWERGRGRAPDDESRGAVAEDIEG